MKRKILCPTDFTEVSFNGIEYAARLAQHLNYSLTLINVQPINIGEGVSLFAGDTRESIEAASENAKKLDNIMLDINKTFRITCDYEIIPTIMPIDGIIRKAAADYDLLVTGSNGAETWYQKLMGSNSYRFSEKVNIPVFIAPEDYYYAGIYSVLLVSDYIKGEPGNRLKVLKDIVNNYNPSIKALHFITKRTSESDESFNSFKSLMKDKVTDAGTTSYEQIVTEDAEKDIYNFIATQPDLLALYTDDKGLLSSGLYSVIKSITSKNPYPLLIMHK